MKIHLDPTIFRDYDIRGIYPKQLNEEVFYVLGRALAQYLKVSEIAVGYDCRLSSASLFKALTSGIRHQGVNVTDLGNISTEMHYFASGKYQFPANVIISASHNPPQYNGLKIVVKGVVPLHGGFGLPEIKKLAEQQDFHPFSPEGKIRKMDIMPQWITHALTFIASHKLKPLKVVVDAGNGMGGISWDNLIGKLPVKIIPLYFAPDGHFPHHLPDPLHEENLAALKLAIAKHEADLGFAIDGDADRLFVVDETGKTLSGTTTCAILASAMLQKYGPAPVLYNVVCGRIVPETVKSLKGTSIRVRVGHSFIKEAMKKHHALFGGEHSGHFYFRDNYFAESSLITGLIILEYLSQRGKPLSSVVTGFDKYRQSGEINFFVKDKARIEKNVGKEFKDADSFDHLDGLSVFYPAWWFNLRASKTEPYVRLNIEADEELILKTNKERLEKLIYHLGGKKN